MSQERVMLLIDADNLSVDVMEQAIRLLLNQHGGLHVRRAYCTAESAVANQNAFKRLGIKPMVNLAAGKNSTDIAMAVDAIDLVLAERPDVVVIASSDSDFAPLVQRLREKGCVVRGIGQKGKVGDETQDVYDDYTVIEHRGGTAARAPARTAAKPARASRAGAGRAAKPQQAAGPEAAAARSPAVKAAGSRGRGGSRRSATALAADDTAASMPATGAADVVAQAAEDLRPSAALASGTPAAGLAAVPAKKALLETPAEPPAAAAATPAAKRAPRARKAAKPSVADADATASAETEAAASRAAQPAAPGAAHPLAEGAAAPVPARSRARKPKVAAEPAPPSPAAKAAAPAAAPSPQQSPAAEPAASSTRAAPRANLQAVLDCLPELSRGQSLALNVAVQRLRETRLLGKNSSSLKLFSQLSDSLELLPARNPSQVRLRR